MMLITANLVTSGAKIFAPTETVITATIDPLDQMTKIASSPERHTFQAEGYIKRCEEEGKDPNPEYLNMFKTWREQAAENLADPEWQKDNMEYDLRTSEYMCSRAKASKSYAQNLYAAMCNRQFQKLSLVPLLKDQRWSCSWRSAGGIVANMIEQGDYIDWYCSGIGDGLGNGDPERVNGYVSESEVTDEIRKDLKQLGWIVLDEEDDDR